MIGEDVMVPSTEADQLRQQLLQAQKLSSVGALASSVAHEFNNILTTIINYARLALRTTDDEAARTQALEKILKGGQRAAVVINSMLGFARNHSTQRERTDLVALVDEVLILTEKDLSKHRIQVEKKFHGRPHARRAGQIEQVLLNLSSTPARRCRAAAGCASRSATTSGPAWSRWSWRTADRHPAGPAAADLRAVLHDQGTGRQRPRRHRAGPERLPADHRTAPGPHPRRESGRQRLDVHGETADPAGGERVAPVASTSRERERPEGCESLRLAHANRRAEPLHRSFSMAASRRRRTSA